VPERLTKQSRLRRRPASAVLLVALLLAGGPALAHKLRVFAFADGARIEGSAYFAGGGKAAGTRIVVKDAAGRTVAELTPAADGSFSYMAKAPVDHLTVAESGDGHRAEWKVSAGELASGFAADNEGSHLQIATPGLRRLKPGR
jgi:nickel transport protein